MERTNPARSAGPDGGARLFGSFWGDCQKELAQQGETKRSSDSPIAWKQNVIFRLVENVTYEKAAQRAACRVRDVYCSTCSTAARYAASLGLPASGAS